MIKKVPASRNPLFNVKQPALEFDNVVKIDDLTPGQQADRFMSRWMEIMHPFSKYPHVFVNAPIPADRTLRSVKMFFKKFVSLEGWTERKYVMVLDQMLVDDEFLTDKTFEKYGKLYDENKLGPQVRMARAGRRRI